MQVPLQPSALGDTGLDDPGARCPNLLQLGSNAGLQPRVFQCQPGGGQRRLQQAGMTLQGPIDNDGRQRHSVASQHLDGQLVRRLPIGLHRMSFRGDMASHIRNPVEDVQTGIAQGVPQCVPHVFHGARRGQPNDQIRHR